MRVLMSSSCLRSDVAVRPPHDTLVAAFEGAACDRAPWFTLHTTKGPVVRTAPDALASAWRWASLLRARGVTRGERVALLMPTGHAFVEAMLGAMLAGGVPVPLAGPMTFGGVEKYLRNLGAIVKDCGARVLVTHGRMAEAAARDEPLARALRHVVTEASLDGLAPTACLLPSIGASDTAFIQYTSGTTGAPKGAVISHGALVANAFAIARGLDIGPTDVGASWLPLFHDMGLVGVVLTSICHPYPVHVISPETFVMRPRRWLELISQVGATLSPAPNFAYELCMARGGEPEGLQLGSWRVALNGAEPVHARTVSRFGERFAPSGLRGDVVMPVYGMAESTLAVAFPGLGAKFETLAVERAALERSGRAEPGEESNTHHAVSVGGPVAGATIEVVDPAGRLVPEGTVGQILVSGPSLMDGYFRNERASAEAIVDRRLCTGDLGFVLGGRLFVTGRAKEIIIKAGRNLSPHDIERVAAEVDGVRNGCVAAFARPNRETGTDDLVVAAEAVGDDPAQRGRIASGVRAGLLEVLGIKPDEIHVCGVGTLPRTTSGKIRRRECARVFAGKDGA